MYNLLLTNQDTGSVVFEMGSLTPSHILRFVHANYGVYHPGYVLGALSEAVEEELARVDEELARIAEEA